MARVVALAPDLFFASKIQETLGAGGHDVKIAYEPGDALRSAPAADVLIVDLDARAFDAVDVVKSLREQNFRPGPPTIGFYSHVDVETKRRAERAELELVIPRSRMARDMLQLVDNLSPRG